MLKLVEEERGRRRRGGKGGGGRRGGEGGGGGRGFFFNDTATTEIYTLSLHDALPISDHSIQPIQHKPQLLLYRISFFLVYAC
mgnify:CR=1 FL=1